MELPPPNTTTITRTIGAKPKLHEVVCTIVCDETTVTFTYRRGARPAHLVESYDRGDEFHLHSVLAQLEREESPPL